MYTPVSLVRNPIDWQCTISSSVAFVLQALHVNRFTVDGLVWIGDFVAWCVITGIPNADENEMQSVFIRIAPAIVRVI